MFVKLQPIRILCFYLGLLAVVGSVSWVGWDFLGYLNQLRNFSLIYFSGLLVYLLGVKFKIINKTRWENRVISSLILFLLFDSYIPWWVFLSLGIVTELFQRVVRVATGPILNPAGAGALVLAALGQYPSWWGASFAPRLHVVVGGISIAAFLTLPIAGYIAYRYKKLWIPLFASVCFVFTYFFIFKFNPLFILLEGTFLFFIFVMAVEPKTSAVEKKEQILFGSVIGILVPILLKLGFYEAYLGALLISNILRYIIKLKRTKFDILNAN